MPKRCFVALTFVVVATRSVPVLAEGWRIDPAFTPEIVNQTPGAPAASVRGVCVLPDGSIAIVGEFTHVNGVAANRMARLRSDGSVDSAFAANAGITLPPANLGVRGAGIVAQPDGKVLVAATAQTTSGVTRYGVARFNHDGSLDESFDAGLRYSAVVNAVAWRDDGVILIGGSLDRESPALGSSVSWLAADGTTIASASVGISQPTNYTYGASMVRELALGLDGKVVAAGQFNRVRSAPATTSVQREGFVRFNPDGSIDESFDANRVASEWHVSTGGRTGQFYWASSAAHIAELPTGEIVLSSSGDERAVTVASDGQEIASISVGQGSEGEATSEFWGYRRDGKLGSVFADLRGGVFAVFGGGSDHPSALVRFFPDGEVDRSFFAECSTGEVLDLVETVSGDVLVAGDFRGFDGSNHNTLVRLLPLDRELQQGHLSNCSIRGYTGHAENHLIVGLVVDSAEPRRLLLRAVAHSLATLGLSGVADLYEVSLYDGLSQRMESHSLSWKGQYGSLTNYGIRNADYYLASLNRTGAFPLDLNGGYVTTDILFFRTMMPGSYTLLVPPVRAGVVLVEVYRAQLVNTPERIANFSARGWVEPGERALIAGFVVADGPVRVLIRGVGTGLSSFGVRNVLSDPKIELVEMATSSVYAGNDNWSMWSDMAVMTEVAARVGAFPLALGSTDAALVADLNPGAYTVVLSDVRDISGVALIELYYVNR